MTVSDDDVRAYVDGALAPDDVARVRAAMAGDVLVAARVERARALRASWRTPADDLRDEASAATRGPPILRATDPRDTAEAVRRSPGAHRWRRPVAALIASAAALAIASWLRAPSGDIVVSEGALVARGALARQLDTAIADAPDTSARVFVAPTFRDRRGRLCRGFVEPALSLAGLACRDGDTWTLPVVTRTDTGAGPAQPGSELPADVRAAVASRMQGDVLNPAQERRARDAGWR